MDTYDMTWGTPMGQDCVSLDATLTLWLGKRLVFLGKYAHTFPNDTTYEAWSEQLKTMGQALIEYADAKADPDMETDKIVNAQTAMRFVADNLVYLWD